MNWLDKLTETSSRQLAQRSSRRGWMRGLGTLMVGAASIPLLPVARAAAAEATGVMPPEAGDPAACDYWRHCAIDGFLCGCCGGSPDECPPGTEMSTITWIGSCRNPVDGKNYIISYNDCCGKGQCGNCLCNRNESDRPPYRPQSSNDINWCLGTKHTTYHCSTAAVIGVDIKQAR